MTPPRPVSDPLDERFDAEDPRFLEELRQVRSPERLAALAERWKKDERPFARDQLFAYLDLPFDVPGHQPLVKRLFKHAEKRGDDELMAAFLAAFDRLVRRRRCRAFRRGARRRDRWIEEEVLRAPWNTLRAAAPARKGALLFTHRTRYYLRRRAWRHFRRLGFQRPKDFPMAAARALVLYRDEELASPEHLLDSFGLLQILFRDHEALYFGATHAGLRAGRRLSDLAPAPRFRDAWRRPGAAGVLLGVVTGARARLVRAWAMELLRREHASRLAGVAPAAIAGLLDHEDLEVQRFGAEILSKASGLDRAPVEGWLRLLDTRSPEALETVCETMARHVSADRLTTQECVQVACRRPAPAARLGLDFLKARPTGPEDDAALAELASALCEAHGREIAAFALSRVARPGRFEVESVSRFFDSLNPGVRAGAWEWLEADPRAADDPALFARLLETPFEDLRLKVVDHVERRGRPSGDASDLGPLWACVLLGIHRGGRQKRKAVGQAARALTENPGRAGEILPLLSVAIRSVRPPEARAGLAALVAAVEARPEIEPLAERFLPELDLRTH